MPVKTRRQSDTILKQAAEAVSIGFVPAPDLPERDWSKISLTDPEERRRFWSVIPEQNREWLQAGYAKIRSSLTRQAKNALEAGVFIKETKGKIPYGKFLELVEPETGVDIRTAERWMTAAEKFGGKFDTVSNLNLTSIYALTEKGPWLSDARKEILERLDNKERLSIQDVQDVCEKARLDHETRYGAKAKPKGGGKAYPEEVRMEADRLLSILKPHIAELRKVMSGDKWLDVFKLLKERISEDDIAKPSA